MKIVVISAVWCPSCLVMRPRFEEIIKKYAEIDSVSYDFDFDEVSVYNPGSILPVFILINDDIELGRLVGEHKLEEMINLIETNK